MNYEDLVRSVLPDAPQNNPWDREEAFRQHPQVQELLASVQQGTGVPAEWLYNMANLVLRGLSGCQCLWGLHGASGHLDRTSKDAADADIPGWLSDLANAWWSDQHEKGKPITVPSIRYHEGTVTYHDATTGRSRTERLGKWLRKAGATEKEIKEFETRTLSLWDWKVSAHPYDVLTMSFNRPWTSCARPGKDAELGPLTDMAAGSAILFFYRPGADQPCGRLVLRPGIGPDGAPGIVQGNKVYGAGPFLDDTEIENLLSCGLPVLPVDLCWLGELEYALSRWVYADPRRGTLRGSFCAQSDEQYDVAYQRLLAAPWPPSALDHPVAVQAREIVARLEEEDLLKAKRTADAVPALRERRIGRVDPSEVSLRRMDLSGVDLSGVDLSGVDLVIATLEGANLTNANLDGAFLTSARLTASVLAGANLTGASLSSAVLHRAHLEGANLYHARMVRADLYGAYLSGASLEGANLASSNLVNACLDNANLSDADLSESNMAGAYLTGTDLRRANLYHANLTSVDLTKVDLRGAYLSRTDMRDSDLSGTDLSGVNLSDTILASANLSGANLAGVNLDGASLDGADLSGANLTNTNLSYTTMRSSELYGAVLSGANLVGADLTGANLATAYLVDTDLSRASLPGAILSGAYLTNANLTGADLTNTNLTDANLEGAYLTDANLEGANLTNANLDGAFLTGTTMPQGFKRTEDDA